jgi:transcription antitermination factor NusG
MVAWFLLNLKPKKELQVERLFREASFDFYLPRARDGRSLRPFFPGYGFLRFDHPRQYQLVHYTRGVKRVVGNEAGPIPLPDGAVDAIRAREVEGAIDLWTTRPEPGPGDEIEVTSGPLKGLRGVFNSELGGHERVLILLNYVSYQGRLQIEKARVRKVERS